MNSCVLMAQIVSQPELRYTQDGNTALTQVWIEFPGLRPDDVAGRIRAVGYGNLATELQQKYHEGDRVILTGRLSMNTIDRPEGFKEKRAELIVSQVMSLGAGEATSGGRSVPTPMVAPPPVSVTPAPSERVVSLNDYRPLTSADPSFATPVTGPDDEDLDDIPF